MRLRAIMHVVLVSVAFLVWQGCDLTEPEDTATPDLPPDRISDVEVVERTLTSVTLTWTAPGGGGIDSIASAYDIRYSTYRYLYLEGHWDSASQVDDEPIPQPAGNQETFVVRNLNPSTEYYFSIKAADKNGSWSAASYSVKAITHPEISTWMRTYDDYGATRSVLSTANSGYICTGSTKLSGGGQMDIYVLKVDDSGNIEWQRTYGGGLDDVADCMVAAPDGGFVIVGRIMESSPCYHDVFLLKIDASGNPIREQTFEDVGSCKPFSIEAVPGGGYILAGGTFSFGSGGEKALLIKVNAAGDLIWQNIYGDPSWASRANSIIVAGNGDYVFAGSMRMGTAGCVGPYIVRVSPSGAIVWERTLCNTNISGETSAIVATPTGTFLVVGGVYRSRIYMTEIDGSGNQIWEKLSYVRGIGGTRSVILAPDGGYMIVSGVHCRLVKVNSSGDVIWNTSPGVDLAPYSVVTTADGGYVISGVGVEYPGPYQLRYTDAMLMKVDANGHINLDRP